MAYGRDVLSALHNAQQEISFMEEIINTGQLHKDLSYVPVLLKLKQGYEKNISVIIQHVDAEIEKRLLYFSNRIWTVMNNYIEGELVAQDKVSLLKTESKIVDRLLDVSSERVEIKRSHLNKRHKWKWFFMLYLSVSLLIVVLGILVTLEIMRVISIYRLAKAMHLQTGGSQRQLFREIINQKSALTQRAESLAKDFEREYFLQRRYYEILNTMSVGIIIVNNHEEIIFLNSMLKRWFNIDSEFVGESLDKLQSSIAIKRLKPGKLEYSESVFWLSKNNVDDIVFYLFQDISEQEEISNKLVNSERLISIGEIATKVTHEIRNPLSTVKLNSEYLLEHTVEMTNDEIQKSLQLIVKEVIRLEEITGRYMNMVRYRSDDELDKGVTLPEDLEQFIGFHSGEFKRRDIEISMNDFPEANLAISLSSFKEIVLNLIKNAWEELEDGGEICIRVAMEEKNCAVIIEDSGKGIPIDEREKIFKNFYTNKPGGTGIGLSHSKKLLEEVGGKLSVSDGDLGGAKFVVYIPIKR